MDGLLSFHRGMQTLSHQGFCNHLRSLASQFHHFGIHFLKTQNSRFPIYLITEGAEEISLLISWGFFRDILRTSICNSLIQWNGVFECRQPWLHAPSQTEGGDGGRKEDYYFQILLESFWNLLEFLSSLVNLGLGSSSELLSCSWSIWGALGLESISSLVFFV